LRVNQYSFYKQKISLHKHISRFGIGTVTVTVKKRKMKRNTENTG